jgi:2-dehydropantoate 2-reductase
MRFLVLGAGALGGLFGGRLLKGGADVTFLVRPRRAGQLRRDGLIVKLLDGEIRTPVKVVQQGQIAGTFDVVLLTCKAYDLQDAITAITPAMGDNSAVLPLLNGVGHIDVLKQRFGAARTLGGLTVINAALLSDGAIQQTPGLRVNMNLLGELDGHKSSRCEAIKEALDTGGIPADVVDDILARMWNKFFGWASIAAISSLTRSPIGVVAKSAIGPTFVYAVIDECTKVAAAEGYPPPPEFVGILREAFTQTADTTSRVSMLVDMDSGRPTESENIGDLVARATQRGIAAPILTAALCNLQAYEINRSQPK